MAITLDELKDLIESLELRCQAVEKLNAVMVGFKLEEESTYRDPQGDACLAIVFRLAEQGEFLSAFVPACWILGETPHRTVVMEVLLAIQTHFKFVRFDLAEHMIVANCELPIEDGTVTASQVQRIIGALMQVVEKFDVHVRKAIDTGDATAADIEGLGEDIRAAVKAKSGVELRWEIKRIGRPAVDATVEGYLAKDA